VIGQRQRRHTQLFSSVNEFANFAQAVKQRVVRMDVEMDKAR